MPDNKLTDNEIIKEIQDIRESMKRHIDLTNEMGQDLLRIDEEYTGGSKVWLTTDYFKKVVKHFCHSNYLVKCMELIFEHINRQQAEIVRLKDILLCFMGALSKVRNIDDIESISVIPLMTELNKGIRTEIKAEAYKEFAERLKESYDDYSDHSSLTVKMFCYDIDNLLKELVGDSQ